MLCQRCGENNSRIGKYCEFCGRETGFPKNAYTKRRKVCVKEFVMSDKSSVVQHDAEEPNSSVTKKNKRSKRPWRNKCIYRKVIEIYAAVLIAIWFRWGDPSIIFFRQLKPSEGNKEPDEVQKKE